MSSGYQDNKKYPGPGPVVGDVEVISGEIVPVGLNEYEMQFAEVGMVKQGLKQRHIQMIALAGTIGTGLFLGSGRAIAHAGPLGAFLGYSIIGVTAAGVVMSVAEMGALIPLNGGIVRYTDTFVDPALAFANGWNLVYSNIVSLPAEIVAAAVLVEFWVTVNNAVWITVFSFLTIATSLFFVRLYGEMEFGFAMLKIILIVMVNVMAIVITAGGAPNHQVIGFKYWHHPGPFVQYLGVSGSLGRFLGFWTTFSNALYSYSGVEGITLAAAEVEAPRRAIPLAARRIFWRVAIFYIVTIGMVGLVVPSNSKQLLQSTGTAAQSPFVIAAKLAHIRVMPHVINAIVLTSAWSAANSGMLSGSRTLYGLARSGRAPNIFLRLNRFGVPYVAIGFFGLFMALGYMTLSDSASTVFTWLQDLISISTLTNWIIICITYLRFYYGCRAQGIDRSELPWAAPFMPWLPWGSLALFLLLLLTSGYTTFMSHHWNSETFVSSYFNIPFIFVVYFGYKFVKKSKIVPLSEIPIRPYIQIALDNPEPPEKPKSTLQKLNILWS
ncbi:amino acid permease [Grosmannia clavigera kw1407]|uniref:Amino acid permease n=1 Tax=Grosmannia clavigera (strain kw1407 / UAMH 11150) TaxID=655863 RepID=F0XBE4_GROCL|nr:amino acid permease [Grosmannia clavigera kw1407]EFX04976.1 amino acid permease [Grosmannia clavigera kw1407]